MFLEFTSKLMRLYTVLLSFWGTNALKTRSGVSMNSNLMLSPRFSASPAQILPVPAWTDMFERYCHVDPPVPARLRVSSLSLLEYGSGENDEPVQEDNYCEEDVECQSRDLHRPFCTDNVCRQCREGNEFSDCGSSAAKCTEETSYMCSECIFDEDCHGGLFCRSTLHEGRKCVSCESVPLFGKLVDSKNCSWQCPIDHSFQSAVPDCVDCPQCQEAQYYAPALTSAGPSFYTTCTNATDPVCTDCGPVPNNFCAQLLSPLERQANDFSIGDIGQSYPCRFFKCLPSWFLDLAIGKCQHCHTSMCAPGSNLVGCGGLNPGACVSCGSLPGDAWVGGCRFTCPSGQIFLDSACQRCDPGVLEGDRLYCPKERREYENI